MSLLFYEGKNFWKSPSEYKPGEQLSNERIVAIENKLGVKLPESYKALMTQQNGGSLSYGYVPFEDGDVVWIPYFQELQLDAGVGMSAIFLEECDLPTQQILIAGDFETWLALDYREDKQEPLVVYWNQSESDEVVWGEYRIANSFAEFLSKIFKKSV